MLFTKRFNLFFKTAKRLPFLRNKRIKKSLKFNAIRRSQAIAKYFYVSSLSKYKYVVRSTVFIFIKDEENIQFIKQRCIQNVVTNKSGSIEKIYKGFKYGMDIVVIF